MFFTYPYTKKPKMLCLEMQVATVLDFFFPSIARGTFFISKLQCGGVHATYIAGNTKCNPKKDQKYHIKIYFAENMYEGQTIKNTASCDVSMMTKSIVSVAAIVAYNHCHTPRYRRMKVEGV
ncbi:uncharacterized protein TNCV_365981 [Trichonephila clavipes]|nr:uncharacterized protein TNCV_365981 [Trichonephila clavipes]